MKIIAGICTALAIGLLLALWRLDHVSSSLDTADKLVTALQAQATAYEQALTVRDSVDAQYQEAIRNAEQSTPQLVADLGTGVKRVYVRAACVPTDPKSTSSAHATAPELAADARQDYADLVVANRKVTAQVQGLQSYITNICQKGTKP